MGVGVGGSRKGRKEAEMMDNYKMAKRKGERCVNRSKVCVCVCVYAGRLMSMSVQETGKRGLVSRNDEESRRRM